MAIIGRPHRSVVNHTRCRGLRRMIPCTAFEPGDLTKTAPVTLGAAEGCLQKCSDQLPGERIPNHVPAQADHVHVVVLDTLARRETFMDETRPHTRHFVGGNARAHAAAADGYSTMHFSEGNCAGQGLNKVRIVIVRFRLAIAKVEHFIVSFTQGPGQRLFQFKTAVIRSDTDALRRGWRQRLRIGHYLLQRIWCSLMIRGRVEFPNRPRPGGSAGAGSGHVLSGCRLPGMTGSYRAPRSGGELTLVLALSR